MPNRSYRLLAMTSCRALVAALLLMLPSTASAQNVLSFDNPNCEDDEKCEGITGTVCVSAQAISGNDRTGCEDKFEKHECKSDCTALDGEGGSISDGYLVFETRDGCGPSASVVGQVGYTGQASRAGFHIEFDEEFDISADFEGCGPVIQPGAFAHATWGVLRPDNADAVTLEYRFEVVEPAIVHATGLLFGSGNCETFETHAFIELLGPTGHALGMTLEGTQLIDGINEAFCVLPGCYQLRVRFTGIAGSLFDYCGEQQDILSCGANASATIDLNVFLLDPGVDLVIHDAQTNAAVAEAEEEKRGAFVVANWNDTDGDGTVDVNDEAVVPVSFAGRPEVDLAKLRIEQLAQDLGGAIELHVLAGEVSFWTHSNKIDNIPAPGGVIVIKTSDLPVEFWMEGSGASMELRDIHLRLVYEPVGPDQMPCGTFIDDVRATAVWSSVVAVEASTRDAEDLFADPVWATMTDPPRSWIELYGGTGLRPINRVNGVRNIIVVKFLATPPGIHDEPDVVFDATRQVHSRFWLDTVTTPCIVTSSKDWPVPVELPNDDSNDLDESPALNEHDEFYQFDTPGLADCNHLPDEIRRVQRLNALDFLRVSFDGTRPLGDVIAGSRCSYFYDWHSRHWLIPDGTGKWQRDFTNPNDIGDGHIKIGQCPP